MRILVVGKNGQLASSFKSVDKNNVLKFYGQNDFDFKNRASIEKILDQEQPQLIINCAAYTLVDLAEIEKEKCEQLNFYFVTYLADWCGKHKSKLIHFSTDYVFDGKKPENYLESDPVCPANWYGYTKAMSEKYLNESNVQATIFRISWVYSEFGNNFLKTMIRLGKEKELLNIVSDQIGSPCYAVNVAEAIYEWIFQIKNFEIKKGIYHLVPSAQVSWYEFADRIFMIYKNTKNDLKLNQLGKINTSDYKTAAVRPLNSRMDANKAFIDLGLRLEPFEISLCRAIEQLV